MNSLLTFALKQLANTDSPIAKAVWTWVFHALGDKTVTVIGSVLAWVPAVTIDTTLLPPNVASVVSVALYVIGILGTAFAGYATRPGVGAALQQQKIDAKGQ